MGKLRVGVIFGSRSVEHAVSIITAHQVMGALDRSKYEVIPIYITRDGIWVTGDDLLQLRNFKNLDLHRLEKSFITPDPSVPGLVRHEKLLDKIDVVFPVVHGTHGEDGTLQGLLELANIPYVGAGVVGSAVGMDKVVMKSVFRDNGLPVVEFRWFTRRQWQTAPEDVIAKIETDLKYPVFVKPANLGSSIGITKAKDREKLQFALDVASHFDRRLIIEEAIENAMEINCSVLGNDEPVASVCEQPLPWEEFLSYEDKYLKGSPQGMKGLRRRVPAPISPELTTEIQSLAIKAFKAIDCRGIARVDFLVDPTGRWRWFRKIGRPFMNEINTMPGSVAFYLWEPMGVKFPELVEKLIGLALEAHEEKKKTIYSSEQDTSLLRQLDDRAPLKG